MVSKNESTDSKPPPIVPQLVGDQFHVFLSHNSSDKEAIRQLKSLLEKRGIKCWYDEDQLRPGMPWQKLLENGIRASKSVIVAVAKSGIGPWEEEEMNAALLLAVKNKLPVIPVLLPDTGETPELPIFLLNRTWVDLRGGYSPKSLDRLIWGITGVKEDDNIEVSPPGLGEPGTGNQKRFIGRRSFLVLGAVGSIGLSTWGLKTYWAKPVKIVIGIKQWIGYTPFAVADQMRLFPPGIEVSFVDVKSATQINQMLAEGSIDIGFLTIADLVNDAHRNFKFNAKSANRPMAAFMIDTSRGADGFVARKNVGKPEDLVGKKLIFQSEDVSEFMLQRYCERIKFDYDELKKQATDETPETAAKLFHDDESIAAAGTYEPHISQILDKQSDLYVEGASVILDSNHPAIQGTIVDIVVAKQSFLSKNRDAMQSLMIGWFHAVDLLNNAPGALKEDHDRAVAIACLFAAEPSKGDDWTSANWPGYDPVSIDNYEAKIKGLAGSLSKPWPDIDENKNFFRRKGSTSSAKSNFHTVFEEWHSFFDLKTSLDPKDFDGSEIVLSIPTDKIRK